MPGWVREGINPSPTLEPLNPDLDYFRTNKAKRRKPCLIFY